MTKLSLSATLVFFLLLHTPANSTGGCGHLYLTQSPTKEKNLQLNWNFTCDDPPDTILLLFKNRTSRNLEIVDRIYPGSVVKGNRETQVSLKDLPFPGNWTQDTDQPDLRAQCFDYYIASAKDNEITYSQCLAIQPTWMSNFGNLRIGDMLIPGTHNSGAWRGGPALIRNYVLNQDRGFWQQLVYGVRYFDIRVGYYGNSSEGLYINHAVIKCTELVPELQSVADFLKKSTKEVVILNFYRFERPRNFTKDHHLTVLNTIKDIFGDSIYPFYRATHSRGPKLSDFWLSGKRVIISYRDDIVKEIRWLWPSVGRDWGDVQKVGDLEKYIKSKAAQPSRGNPMRVLMAELTPTYFSVIKHVTRDLKDLSVMVNRELSDWVREDDRADNFNIIATDFFTGNDIINVAIETNLRKLKRSL